MLNTHPRRDSLLESGRLPVRLPDAIFRQSIVCSYEQGLKHIDPAREWRIRQEFNSDWPPFGTVGGIPGRRLDPSRPGKGLSAGGFLTLTVENVISILLREVSSE